MLKFQDDYITKNENMEDLFTIILAIVDDLYQIYAPDEIRNRKNIAEARCSDAEIITISIVGEMMGVDSETAWHSFVKKNYSHLFPHLGCRSRYHRRKKNLYLLTELLRAKLEKEMDVGLCENYIADSYPLPVCKFGRAYFCKSFRYEGAAYGRCPSKKETYYGYKVHVLTTMDGYISRYIIGKANEDDREGLYHLTEGLYGITILGDKGYSGRAIREAMAEHGITLLALKPSHQKDQWVKHFRQIIFRFRRKIEAVFSQLTCQMNGEQVLARSFWGLCSRVGYKILAHNLAMVVIFCSTGCLSTASMKALIF